MRNRVTLYSVSRVSEELAEGTSFVAHNFLVGFITPILQPWKLKSRRE